MDITAASISHASASVQQQAAFATIKNAMDVAEVQNNALLEMMEKASPPSQHRLDIRA